MGLSWRDGYFFHNHRGRVCDCADHIRLLRGPLLLEEKAGCLEAREGEKRPADVIGAAP